MTVPDVIFTLFILVLIASFGVLAYVEHLKVLKLERAIQDAADELNAKCVSKGFQIPPEIVMDQAGQRIRVALRRINPAEDRFYTASYNTKVLHVSLDGFDPYFKFGISTSSVGEKVGAWLKQNRCPSGMPEFDSMFVVTSNMFQDEASQLVSPQIATELISLSRFDKVFDPAKQAKLPYYGDPQYVDPYFDEHEAAFETKQELDKAIQTIKRRCGKRFQLRICDGKGDARLFMTDVEYPFVAANIRHILRVLRELQDNFIALDKAVIKKPV